MTVEEKIEIVKDAIKALKQGRGIDYQLLDIFETAYHDIRIIFIGPHGIKREINFPNIWFEPTFDPYTNLVSKQCRDLIPEDANPKTKATMFIMSYLWKLRDNF